MSRPLVFELVALHARQLALTLFVGASHVRFGRAHDERPPLDPDAPAERRMKSANCAGAGALGSGIEARPKGSSGHGAARVADGGEGRGDEGKSRDERSTA